MESLVVRTARAAQWRLAGAGLLAGSQLAVTVVLARLLTPTDFGLMALTLVVTGLIQPFSELGVGAAIVQRREMTERHLRVAFTLATLLGIACAAAVALAAPLLAAAVGDTRATPMLRVLAAAFAIRGIAVVSGAVLRRQFDFRRLFVIDAVASVAGSGAAVGLAVAGYGVWSLVWGAITQVVLSSVAQAASVRHPWQPLLAGQECRELFGYSAGSAASGLINYVARNADNFVVGRWLGALSLGLYDRAYALMNVPFTYLSGAVSSVLFPAFANVQSEPHRLRAGYLLSCRLTAMASLPLMCIMAVAAPHLVVTLFGPRWSGIAGPLQILCLAGYFRALYHVGGVVVQSVGRVYTELALQCGYALLVICGSLAGWRFGVEGVAIAVTAAIVCMFVATVSVSLQVTGISSREYFHAQRHAFVTALACGAAAIASRVVLERSFERSDVVTIGIVVPALVPWVLGAARMVRTSDLPQLRVQLPAWLRPLAT
jgi:PST family polysaccharide transporter